MNNDVVQIANGKWPSILISLGVPELAVSGKHSPCPMCKGKDRFRMIELDGRGRWVCNQCGSGDAMNLAEEFLGLSFNEVAKKVKPLVMGATYASAPKKPNSAQVKRQITSLMNTWREAKDREVVTQYLLGRGLPKAAFSGADLRGSEIDYYADGKNLGKRPVMLSRIINPQNKTACLHRTYILEDGTEKKMTKTIGPWTGGAIRLFSTKNEDTLIVAEGIETALAARWLDNLKNKRWLPAWAAVNANAMRKLAVPTNIKKVLIMADNDKTYTGHSAAYDLANRLVVRQKLDVQVYVPPTVGDDWLDILVKVCG